MVTDGQDSWICATGVATEETYSEYATDVYVKLNGSQPAPGTPPNDATHIVPNGEAWKILKLAGANWHYYGYGAHNYMDAWAHFPSAGWKTSSGSFLGVFNTSTFCEQQGSASLRKMGAKPLAKLIKAHCDPKGKLPKKKSHRRILRALTRDPRKKTDPGCSLRCSLFSKDVPLRLVHSNDPTIIEKYVGRDPGTGTGLELYARAYPPRGKARSGQLMYRITCLARSPLFPSLVALNWNFDFRFDLLDSAASTRKTKKRIELILPMRCFTCNNLQGPNNFPIELVVHAPTP